MDFKDGLIIGIFLGVFIAIFGFWISEKIK
jgi:hypothetical protein